MVVLVMIDGARPDALAAAGCPQLEALRARGASTLAARSVMPSVTLPCHTSIFHSVPPERHGVTTNTYTPPVRPIPGLVETLTAADRRCAFIYNWEPLRDLSRPEQLSYAYFRAYTYSADTDEPMADEAVRLLGAEHYDFVFLYFGSVDLAGHGYGWMSPEYLGQLSRVDSLLGRVVAALPAEAHILVQSDHGGHERTHGTEMDEDMTIPWIVAGPGVRAGHAIAAPVSLLDTAPTVARLLGVAAPPAWEGRAPAEIFA
jgi:predicted AlkP superfamily pyrophosphatase or phosphodiesterase